MQELQSRDPWLPFVKLRQKARKVSFFTSFSQSDNASVPVFLEKMCEHLLANGAVGVKTKGIFRVPPAKAELDEAKKEVRFRLICNSSLESSC